MATSTKKGSKNSKAKPHRAVVKTTLAKRGQTIAELRRELEARNRDLSALYDVTAAASQSLEIKPVLEEVVKKITDIFAFDSVSVFLFDPKNEVLNLMAAAGIHEIQALPRAFRRGRGLTGRVAETGQYLIFEDVRSDPRYRQLTENNAMQRMGDCFIAIFPIKAKEKFLGTINCINTEPRKLTTGEIRLINSMADQIGVAVNNINLFEEVENKTKDLETSNAELREALEHQTATSEVLGIISRSPTDVQPVLNAIVESAAKVCGIDDVHLRLRAGNVMISRAHFGPIHHGPVEVSIDAPLVRWVRERGTLHIPDVRAQNEIQLMDPGPLRTFLTVPLRQQEEVIGALVARRTEVHPFTPSQIKLLETFADQAVIAIENVRLFQELKESLEQQTATSEILGVIASSPTDIQPVLDVVAENAARVCGATDAVIFRIDGNSLNRAAHFGPILWAGGEESSAISRGLVAGRAVVDRRTIHIHDMATESETEFPEGLSFQKRAGHHRTILATPLLREGIPIGTIMIRRTEVRPFSEKQIKLLETFADQAVIAIENVRLFKEIQERNAELREALEHQTATSEVLGIISRSPTDVQPVLDAIVESAARVCGIDDVVLRLRDGNTMFARAHFGPVPIAGGEIGIDAPLHRRIREHGTLHIPDIRADNDFPMLRSWRAYLGVPLRQQGELVGTLVARRTEVRPFTPAQIKLLETFADQAVIAIENVRLFNELKESLEQQTATSEILGVIASSPTDLQPVLDVVAENAAKLCDAIDGVILRPEGDSLRVVAKYGAVPVPTAGFLPFSRGFPAGRAVIDRQTIHIHDIEAEIDTEYPDSRVPQQITGTRTVLNTPLLREGVAIGCIGVRRTEVRPFTEKQITLLKTFADQAVIAIENVRLFRELQDRNRDLTEALEQQTATSEILRVISSSPTDLTPVFETIVNNARRLCGADSGGLFRFDGELLHFVTMVGQSDEWRSSYVTREPFRPGRETATRLAALERRVVHVPDILAAPEFTEYQTGRHAREGIRSALAVPLLKDDRLLGVITISHRPEARKFTDGQIALVKTFADQAVIAIENVRLFKELQERNAELREALEHQTATAEVLGIISRSPTDVQPVLDAIVESAAKVCGIDDVVLALREGNSMVPRAHFGPIPIGRVRSIDEPQVRWIREHGTLHIPDVRAQNDFPTLGSVTGSRTFLLVPLRQQGEQIGVLVARRTEVRPFTPAQIKLLETFADQAVIAIENVRLFNELKESLEQQTATSEILGVIASSPTDIQPVLDTVAENAVRVCGAEDVLVWRLDSNSLRLVARCGSLPSREIGFERPLGGGTILGRAVIDRQTIHIHDLAAAEAEFPNQLGLRAGVRTVLAMPLLREGNPIGVIHIRRKEVQPFSDK